MFNVEETKNYTKQTKKDSRYIIIPRLDSENNYTTFDIMLEEDYEEIEKLKEQAFQKTIKKI